MTFRSLLASLFVLLLLVPTSASAAPVTRTVEDRFDLTVGWVHEPAILGDTNGLRLQITEDGDPLTAAASGLVANVEFTEATRALTLIESPTEPGVYIGTFIPMQVGDYSFTLTGSIDNLTINETFTVADGLLPVSPRTDYEFPNAANGFAPRQLALPVAATALIGIAMLVWRKRAV